MLPIPTIGKFALKGPLNRKYYLSNLPGDTPLKKLVGAIKACWVCAQAHERLKKELGLDHLEGRSWQGLTQSAIGSQKANHIVPLSAITTSRTMRRLARLNGLAHYCAPHNFLPLISSNLMTDPRMIVMEAIARKRLLAANYNGLRIDLAPHLLFERHGDLFVSALNLGKTWRSDEDPRLGQFKLAGLGAPEVLEAEFEPLPGYSPEAPRETDTVLLSV